MYWSTNMFAQRVYLDIHNFSRLIMCISFSVLTILIQYYTYIYIQTYTYYFGYVIIYYFIFALIHLHHQHWNTCIVLLIHYAFPLFIKSVTASQLSKNQEHRQGKRQVGENTNTKSLEPPEVGKQKKRLTVDG